MVEAALISLEGKRAFATRKIMTPPNANSLHQETRILFPPHCVEWHLMLLFPR